MNISVIKRIPPLITWEDKLIQINWVFVHITSYCQQWYFSKNIFTTLKPSIIIRLCFRSGKISKIKQKIWILFFYRFYCFYEIFIPTLNITESDKFKRFVISFSKCSFEGVIFTLPGF